MRGFEVSDKYRDQRHFSRLVHDNTVIGNISEIVSVHDDNIDMATGVITFYDDLVGLNMTKGDEILLRTVNTVRIPPKSEALIPVSVPTFFKSKISLIEPAANLHYKNLALAKAIVLPKNNTTVCKILNPTDTHIFLKRRTTVAVIEKLLSQGPNSCNVNLQPVL